jgi:hypothetical protein
MGLLTEEVPMRKALLAAAVAIALAATIAWLRPAPSDLERYMEERRAAGMTEEAEMNLGSIADVRSGGTFLTYQKRPDGTYSRLYMSTTCARPGADPKKLAAFRRQIEERMAIELQPLKKLADANGSGFVSTREGVGTRDLIEFAWEVTYLADHEGRDRRRLAHAMGLTPTTFDQTLRDYRNLLHRGAGIDPKLKEVPL